MTVNISARIDLNRHRVPIGSAVAPGPGAMTQCAGACSNCNLRGLCTPCCGLTRSEMDVADLMVCNRLHLRRGESLYRSGERFSYLYVVRSGFLKSTALCENACDQVLSFSIVGDVLGMDAIGPEQHTCSAVALEESYVAAIPFAWLQGLAREIPGLQRQLHRSMSREIVRANGKMLLLGCMNAHERLAMFLLDMSRRFAARGYSPSEFNLRMSRGDIGSNLGMTLETVSRTFAVFQQTGLIRVKQKFVRIVDSAGLERLLNRDLN